MDVLLSRILKYLNGALFYDDYYKFCTYIVEHYLEIEDTEKKQILEETGIDEANLDRFVGRLKCGSDWESFRTSFVQDHLLRLDQIRGRMLGINSQDLLKNVEKDKSDQEILDYVSEICEQIDRHQRIVLVGALYPMSIAVEFQTDLITFGKKVLQFHNFDPDMQFSEQDMIIFISATGRTMKDFLSSRSDLHPETAKSLLITQNPTYTMEEHKISNYVLKLPGKYDGLHFNYQLMSIFDLLRIQYYQKYYLGR